MKMLTENFDNFTDYLTTRKSPEDLKKSMEELDKLYDEVDKLYDYKAISFHRDFHIIPINAYSNKDRKLKEELKKSVGNFLDQLNVSKDKENYLNCNLPAYDLLLKIRREHHHTRIQLDPLIELIEAKTASQKRKFVIGGVFVAASAIAATVSQIGVSGIMTIVQAITASPINVPILGFIGTSVIAGYTLYQNHFNPKISFWESFRNNAFVFSQSVLNTASYVLWIGAATAVMTPLVAGLSVAAAGVDVAKEVFELVRGYRQSVKNSLGNYVDRLSSDKGTQLLNDKMRRQTEYNYKQHARAAGINLFAAVALVGIIAIWNFFPPALVVTVGAVAAMAVVYAAKFVALEYSKRKVQEGLNNELKKLEEAYADSLPSETMKVAKTIENAVKPQLNKTYSSDRTMLGAFGVSEKKGNVSQNSKTTSNSFNPKPKPSAVKKKSTEEDSDSPRITLD